MMGRKKEKEKSPQSPAHRFLGRSSGPAKPKVANVSVDGAQNGGLRLRYYGQTDSFVIAGGPDTRGHNGSSGMNSSGGNHPVGAGSGAMMTSSFTTFGVPSQPQPTSGISSSVSSSPAVMSSPLSSGSGGSGGGVREYQPPRAANLLAFQASPMQSPSHHSSAAAAAGSHNDNILEEEEEEEDSMTSSSISNGTPPNLNNGSSKEPSPAPVQMRSLIPVSAQVHRPNSIEKSKSEEDLNGAVNGDATKAVENGRGGKDDKHEPYSDGIVREKTPVHMRRHSTGENLGKEGSPPPRAQSPPISEASRSGNRSPGSQSLVSITSTATVISTSGGLDGAGRDARGKQTLGDILGQIEQRAKSLLSKTKFTTADALPDLQYLAHQSRYSSDAAIKRRITQKLVECNVVQIFVRVFKSVHSVDYLGMEEESAGGGAANGGEVSASKGASKSSVDSVGSGGSSNASIDGATGSSSGSSGGAAAVGVAGAAPGAAAAGKPMGKPPAAAGQNEKNHHCTDAMKNLRAVITILLNTTEKLGQLPVCEDCVHQGVVSLILTELGEPGFVSTELGKDQNKLYLVKVYLGILQNILRFYSDGREAFRSAGAVKILQQYLKSSLLMVKTRTIMLLSHIMSESENDIINASDKNLGFAVKMLQSAVEGENHYSKKYGFWAVEAAADIDHFEEY